MSTSQDPTPFPTQAHKLHHENQLRRYASSGKGIIFALPPTNTYGDFAHHIDYTWSSAARHSYLQYATIPITLSSLPPTTKLVTYTFHIPCYRRAIDGDMHITNADFERLEATPKATAVMWLLSAEYVSLMPKVALTFTEAQRQAYRVGAIRDESAPCVGECLSVGFRLEDQVVGEDGRVRVPGVGGMGLVSVGEVVESLRGEGE